MNDDNSFEGLDAEHSQELVSSRLPSSNNIIRGQEDSYAVGKRIASGKYGAVYEVLRTRDGKLFAAKLEVCDIATRALSMDYLVLKAANKSHLTHFCNLIDRGMIQKHFKFLIMNRLGENLYKLRLQFQHYRFSAPTALRLSLEMLSALEQLHSLGYVHRDVKPSNFALLQSKDNNKTCRIMLIDFGLCRQFKLPNGEIKPPRENTQFRGTIRYAPLAAHRAQEQSPKDDLESWLYVVAEFMAGELPWSGYHGAERDEVRRIKEETRSQQGMIDLLKHCPRMEFRRILTYLDQLDYNTLPSYQYVRDLISLAIRNNDINPEEPYDWEQQNEEDEGDEDDKDEDKKEEKNGSKIVLENNKIIIKQQTATPNGPSSTGPLNGK
ncbi:unnamed protein product [Meloidogyne enterolobii]|uniref:Uncharacterized protein n=3 Tax=Meloidogyne enterolobii TaxID=390850 RepID=A0ACB0XMP2_MELEN